MTRDLVRRKSGLWTPEPAAPWMPSPAVLRGIQHERADRLERDYRWLILQRTGLRPRGDWLDQLRSEITRWAVPAFVNKGTKAVADPGTTLTPSYTGGVAGNLGIALFAASRFTTTAGALTVPSGWTAAENPTSVGNQGSYSTNVGFFYIPNWAAGAHSAALTGLPAGGSAVEGIIAEFSGLDTVAPLDTAHNHNASGTAGTSGTTGSSGAASQSNVLWIAIAHAENGSNTSGFTSSIAGWTTIANTTSNAAGVAWWCGYQIAAVNTAVNPAFGWTSASVWAGAVAGFLPPGAGGTGGIFPFFTLRQAGMRGLTGGMIS